MRKIINVTDITEYLYCPRKVYLKLVKGIREPPSRKMIFGMLRHKVFDLFNKNESVLVSGIKTNINEKEILAIYKNFLIEITKETFLLNKNLAFNFKITYDELLKSVNETMDSEILLRINSVRTAMNLGFFGRELWRNLKPKYLTEYKLESFELGLRGRIDRVRLDENIEPYEIKTRERIFDSDKIQLAAYALLLESQFGKKVEKGIIELLGKKEEVMLDKEIKNEVLEIAEKIRNMTEGVMPENFNKCRECRFKDECE